MSLRDQLVAKGLASKKDKRKANQNLRERRKKSQGARRKQRQVLAEAEARKSKELHEIMARRAAARRDQEQIRALLGRKQHVYSLIRDNEVRSRGRIRFHFPDLEHRFIEVVEVSHSVATSLRRGHAAIVAFDHGGRVEYRVVSATAAVKLHEIAPELVLFHVRDTNGLPDPAEEFWEPGEAIDLRPHRARPEEIRGWRERVG